jgi:hypothetical protein
MSPDQLLREIRRATREIRRGSRESALVVAGMLALAAIPAIGRITALSDKLGVMKQSVQLALALVACVLLGYAVVIVARQAIPPDPLPPQDTPSPIKGPFPFGPDDAQLFGRLCRTQETRSLLGPVLDDQVPLVVVRGASGCGKTSLLRAALVGSLRERKLDVRYWEAEPVEAGRKLLRVTNAGLAAPAATLNDLLAPADGTRRCIIIDQAEQLSESHTPEIFDLLRRAVQEPAPYSICWVVAYRREYESEWRDFELSLDRFYPPTITIRDFALEEAQDVVAVLADESNMVLNQSLVSTMLTGVATNGRVSPVDVGILLLVLQELARATEGHRLTAEHYRRAGGSEGLLTQYVGDRLDEIDAIDRAAVLRAVWALVDSENDLRIAAGKPISDLRSAAAIDPKVLGRHLSYLASTKVRVLEQLPSAGTDPIYRLAHDRLVAVVRRMSGSMLVEAERASRLLDRRYKLWADEKTSRLLLSSSEVRMINRSISEIQWGAHREEKNKFLEISLNRRRQLRIAMAMVAITLCVVARVVWGLVRGTQIKAEVAAMQLTGLDVIQSHLETLVIPNVITSTDWLDGNLRNLSFGINHDTRLNHLPNALRSLRLEGSGYDTDTLDARDLPRNLEELYLTSVAVKHVGALPSSLQVLILEDSDLSEPILPRALRELRISNWHRMDGLPPHLSSLHLELSVYDTFDAAQLPRQIQSLDLTAGHIVNLSNLPPHLRDLSITRTGTGARPPIRFSELPRELQSLSLDSLGETKFAELPTHLTTLVLQRTAPEIDYSKLPASVRKLVVFGIPKRVPNSVFQFGISGVAMTFELRTVAFDFYSLPRNLRSLCVANVSVDSFHGLPDSLTTLHMINVHPISNPQNALQTLPRKLRNLVLDDVDVGPNITYPETIDSLYLSGRTVRQTATLPPRLESLTLSPYNPSQYPKLPQTIRELSIEPPYPILLDSLPPTLQKLTYLSVIRTLRLLPRSLRELHLSGSETRSCR